MNRKRDPFLNEVHSAGSARGRKFNDVMRVAHCIISRRSYSCSYVMLIWSSESGSVYGIWKVAQGIWRNEGYWIYMTSWMLLKACDAMKVMYMTQWRLLVARLTVSRCVVSSSSRGAEHFGFPPSAPRLGNQRPWYVQPRLYATGHIKDPVPLIEKRRGLSPGGRFPPNIIHQVPNHHHRTE